MKTKKLHITIIVAIATIIIFSISYKLEKRCGYLTGERWDAPASTFLWIDDDGHPDGMRRAIALCNKYKIRCTFAIVGKEIEANRSFYDSCQQAGFTIVCHSFSHSKNLNPDNKDYSPDSLSADIEKGRKAFASLSADSAIYVYPGNCGKDFASRKIVSSKYKYCFGGKFLPTDYIVYPRRHYIPRYSINKHTPIADFKAHVDRCRKMGIPVVIGTHSYNDEEWADDYVSACLEYIRKIHYFIQTSKFYPNYLDFIE